MSYKYSVIIPIYKAEKTLRRCVDSLLKQNYTDAEIILVNDGSPDNCGAICEEYAEKYPQIKYICKENGGVSSARNAGLDAASGTYIMFVDSDDWVAEDYFEQLDKAMAEGQFDLMQFSMLIVNSDGVRKSLVREFESRDTSYVFAELSSNILRYAINSPVNKVYRCEILTKNSIRFNEKLSISEDWCFNICYALHIRSLKTIARPLYSVSAENENSLSRRIIPDIDRQGRISEQTISRAMAETSLDPTNKAKIQAAINFSSYRSVYTRAKLQHRQGVGLWQRLKNIRSMCRRVNVQGLEIPHDRFCTAIMLTVKLRLALVIDLMAWVLVRK